MKDLLNIVARPCSTPWLPAGCEQIVELHFWDYPTTTVFWASAGPDVRVPVYAERVAETSIGEMWVYCRVSDNERHALELGVAPYAKDAIYPFEELGRIINGRPIVIAFHSADGKHAIGGVVPDGRLVSAIAVDKVLLPDLLGQLGEALVKKSVVRLDFRLDDELYELIDKASEADVSLGSARQKEIAALQAMWADIATNGIGDLLDLEPIGV